MATARQGQLSQVKFESGIRINRNTETSIGVADRARPVGPVEIHIHRDVTQGVPWLKIRGGKRVLGEDDIGKGEVGDPQTLAAVTAESRAGADGLSSARRLGPTLSARLPGIQQDGGMALAGSDDKNQERRAEGGIIFHGRIEMDNDFSPGTSMTNFVFRARISEFYIPFDWLTSNFKRIFIRLQIKTIFDQSVWACSRDHTPHY